MFTGIVETIGHVASTLDADGARRLRIDAPALADALAVGDSVAVNGVCLTVEHRVASAFEATAVAETLARTTLGALAGGDAVHLERAAGADRLFGGHIVQGHVDGIARVVTLAGGAGERTLTLEVPAAVHALCVEKGSVALDGVSLTLARVDADGRVSIAIVPHTLASTTIGIWTEGRAVNVEADVIAKYVYAFVRRLAPAGS